MAPTDAKQPDDRRWPVQSTAEHLTRAAGRVIARRGSEFSMTEVAAEASVSRPTLYRYFPTKNNILRAVATDSAARFAAGLEAATSGVPRAERMERALDFITGFTNRLPRDIVDVAPDFALQQLAAAIPYMRARWLEFLDDCFGVSALFRPDPEACHDLADRLVRIGMSYVLFPSKDPDGYAKALRAVAGFPPPTSSPVESAYPELGPEDANVALQALHDDGVALRDAVSRSPEAAVPSCPGWTGRDLLGHVAGVHRWALQVVADGAVPRLRLLPEPPSEFSGLVAWYTDGLEELAALLGGTDPGSPVWTPTAGVVGSMWWRRKIAVETALHRWDAQYALAAGGGAPPEAIRATVAVAGINEYVTDLLPGMLAGAGGPSGAVRLDSADTGDGWDLDLGPGGGAATIRGTASDLLLWMWNRLEHPTARLQVDGTADVVGRWPTMRI